MPVPAPGGDGRRHVVEVPVVELDDAVHQAEDAGRGGEHEGAEHVSRKPDGAAAYSCTRMSV